MKVGHDGSWLERPQVLLYATIALGVGCVVGIVASFVALDEDQAIGPLSDWVPGLLTAIALTYTLAAQRRADSRQRAADERQREADERQRVLDERQQHADERQREAEAAAIERERRAQADCVYTWLSREREGTISATPNYYCVLLWSNVSGAPVFDVEITLMMSNGGRDTLGLGTIPPHTTMNSITLKDYKLRGDAEPTAQDRYPIAARMEFRDARGRHWTRTEHGVLHG